MGQVPQKPIFALVGQGRVGRAFAAYLKARQLPFIVLERKEIFSLAPSEASSLRAVLLAISDPSIAEIANKLNKIYLETPLVHFSGSIRSDAAIGFHPLYYFTNRTLSVEEFEMIPFVSDPGGAGVFRQLFCEFQNPVVEVTRDKDAFYHALCVLLGNLPLLIQDRSARLLSQHYGLPPEACIPFLQSLLKNFAESAKMPASSLVAGPVARRDELSTQAHLKAVSTDPFLSSLYRILVQREWPEFPLDQGEPLEKHT
jgi:predicted short-subunit dehydrogenase-like oxidoreductase (DUF2520 family)